MAIVPPDLGRNRSKTFFFKWLWLQQLAPPDCQTFPTALTKICMQKYAYYKKKSCKNGFTDRLSTIGATILRSKITSSPLEFGTRIPIRILEDFWSEFLIIFINKKKHIHLKFDFQNYLSKLQVQFIIQIGILIYLGKYNEIKKNIETSQFTNRITVEE